MRTLVSAAAVLMMTVTGVASTAAVAQDGYRHDGYGRDDRRGRDDYRSDRRDDRRDWRNDRRDWRGDRGGYARYARGQRYRGDGVYLSDYGRYGYRAPPRGYRYYRTGNGDVVLAAIATGLIASVIASNSRY